MKSRAPPSTNKLCTLANEHPCSMHSMPVYLTFSSWYLLIFLCVFCVAVKSKSCEPLDNSAGCSQDLIKNKLRKMLLKNYDKINSTVKNITTSNNESYVINLSENLKLNIQQVNNNTYNISVRSNNATEVLARGMKMSMKKVKDLIPYLIIPGFLMSGILPWIMPGIKMAVMMVGMMNQMAFTSALFMLVRNYVFNSRQDEHIIYVNHGYKNKMNYHNHR